MVSAAGHDGEGKSTHGFTGTSVGAASPVEDDGKSESAALSLINRILASAGPDCHSRRFTEAALSELRAWTGCDAAAVRLEEAGDYPYFAVQGYPPGFVDSDNHLIAYDEGGNPLRDTCGRPALECLCGSLIRDLPHPALAHTATGRSFWTGSMTELENTLTGEEGAAQLRGRCRAWGYESAAALPLRAGDETYGLLQLGSKRKHALDAGAMAVLEPAVEVIATFLHQLISDETRRLGEAHYKALFENMSEAFAYCRILYDERGAPFDWVFVTVNEAFCTLFALKDVIGKRASAVLPGVLEIQPERLQTFARVAATGKPEKEESFFALHGLWLETSVSSPAAGHFLAIFRDHTERRRHGEALRRSQFSLDNVADYPIWSNVDARIVEVSESTCRQLQYSREELLTMTLFDIDPRLSPERWVAHWETIRGTGSRIVKTHHRKKNGELLPVEVMANHFTFNGTEYDCAFCRDTSERIAAEEALQRIRFSLDHMTDYPTWLDDQGRLIEVSQSTCDHLGYSREELLKMTVFDIDPFMTPEQWPAHWEQGRKLGSRAFEAWHRTKTGRVYPVEIASTYMTFGGHEYECGFCRDISERKQAEEKLQRAQYALDNITDYPIWLDSEGRIAEVSQATCRNLGYSREELLAMTVFDLNPTMNREQWRASWERTAKAGSRFVEIHHRKKNGELIPVEVSATHVIFDGTEYDCGFCRDITDRKRLEESLVLTQVTVDQAPDPISWVAEDGHLVYTNQAFRDLLGYSAAEFQSLHIWDFAVGESPELFRSRWQEATQSGLLRHEVVLRGKDGSEFSVEVSSNNLELGGRRMGVSFLRDHSERRRAQEELEDSRRILRTVLDTVPLHVYWKDSELRYLGCNMTGALAARLPDPEAIVGLTDADMVWAGNAEALRKDDFEVLETGVPKLHYEESVTHPGGDNRIIRTSKVPLRDRSGQIIGVLGVHEDITERTQTLRALRERDEQLRQSQKMEAIGRLAGGIAHDFNNVLTTIIGYSDLILASPENSLDTLAEDVGEIRDAAERASSLTKQILAFSRRQTLQPRVLSLNTVISTTERLLARTIGADVELEVACQPELGLVEVDEHQLVQVLLNLAVNARDAMPQGGRLSLETQNVELTEEFCQTHPDAHTGRYVQLSVSDTGIGMDQDTVAHVFEPFYTTKAPGEGTGLGLAMVYGVVAQSGGCIYVTTEPGRGSTFDIYLPRFDHVLEEPALGVRGREPGSARPTILLVDDDLTFRSVTVRMLEKRGYRVLPVGDGDQAAALLENRETPIDLLLTDVVLPGSMQGIHIAQRAARLRPGMRTLFMSSYSRDTIEKSGRLEEGTDYLEKPFTAENLAQRIRDGLDAND